MWAICFGLFNEISNLELTHFGEEASIYNKGKMLLIKVLKYDIDFQKDSCLTVDEKVFMLNSIWIT